MTELTKQADSADGLPDIEPDYYVTEYNSEPLEKALRQLHVDVNYLIRFDPTREFIDNFKLPEQFIWIKFSPLPATTNEEVTTFYPSDALVDLIAAVEAEKAECLSLAVDHS